MEIRVHPFRLAAAALILSTPAAWAIDPPVVARNPKDNCHVAKDAGGEETQICRTDDYSWLRQREAVEVIEPFSEKQPWKPGIGEYIGAEMAYADSVWKAWQPLNDRIQKEAEARLPHGEATVPVLKGGYEYYSFTPPGKIYAVYARKSAQTGKEEVLLDLNAIAAATGKTVNATAPEVSPDGKRILFALDLEASFSYGVYVKDLATGNTEMIRRKGSTAWEGFLPIWSRDGTQVLYLLMDGANRPYDLRRHAILPFGAPAGQETGLADESVYVEDDETLFLYLNPTRDGKYAVVFSKGYVQSEARVLDLSKPDSKPVLLAPKRDGHIYSVDHADGRFFIRTNKGATNFKLVTAPDADPSEASWSDFMPYQPRVTLENVFLFKGRVVLQERIRSYPRFRVVDAARPKPYVVPLPTHLALIGAVDNVDYLSTKFRYRFETYVDPKSIREFDFETGKTAVLSRTEVPGYDPSRYAQKRIFAKARDGKPIPISLVWRKDLPLEGSRPMFAKFYGNYGLTFPEAYFGAFDLAMPSLLDRGVVWAFVHTRGSADMGYEAYLDGKLLRKHNTFFDTIDGLEHLYREGYSSPDKTVAQSLSAGGLTIGYLVNNRPDIAKAFIANVPFVDLISTELDSSIPLTSQEWLEWGNPYVKEQYDYLIRYSPYDNVPRADAAKKRYPPIFVTTHLNDYAVYYWEPLKWVAKMRANASADSGKIILRVWPEGQHIDDFGKGAQGLRRGVTNATYALQQLGITQ
jgi:oligopeptidase B